LLEVGVLAEMLVDELGGQRLIGSLGNDALLVEHSEDTHRLFDELDTSLEIETEVNEDPVDTLTLVLL
ncbi:hypothetical protein PFISCL1PPCAC_23919, partial [Pristionchus fissidentatus]